MVDTNGSFEDLVKELVTPKTTIKKKQMDKTYFSEIPNIYDKDKMVFKFTHPTNQIDVEGYCRVVVKQFFDLLKYCNVDLNRHISQVGYHLEDGEENSRIIYLDVNINEGNLSKKSIRSNVGVLEKVRGTPINRHVICNEIKYLFTIYNIEDAINEDAKGIFIYSVTVPDERDNIEYSHVFILFDKVTSSNKESIQFAKANGALHYWYYDSSWEHEMNKVINDIRESDDYKYQELKFPHLLLFPNTD